MTSSRHESFVTSVQIGFCVVYRWKVAAGREQDFCDAWEIVTREILKHEGGLGSRLHRTADGTWVAYAQWPNQQMWEQAEVTTPDGQAALRILTDAIEERMEPQLQQAVIPVACAQQTRHSAMRLLRAGHGEMAPRGPFYSKLRFTVIAHSRGRDGCPWMYPAAPLDRSNSVT